MRALVVDDERLARNELRRLLGSHPEIEIVGEAASAREARKTLSSLDPDLLFLDVQMPGETGFDLLASIDRAPVVVFTTAYDEYALRAFEVSALDYLVKPVQPKRLAATVGRLLAARSSNASANRTASAIETTTEHLRRLLGQELCGGDPTLQHMASRLHMSSRTLHAGSKRRARPSGKWLPKCGRIRPSTISPSGSFRSARSDFSWGFPRRAPSTAPSSAGPVGGLSRTVAPTPERRTPGARRP